MAIMKRIPNLETLIVSRIVIEAGRILLYGHANYPDYHIIARVDCDAKVGDEIRYEPDGWNFGWFVSVLKSAV